MASPPRPKWLPTDGPGNMNVPPEMWGMTLKQWCAFITACRFSNEGRDWAELEQQEIQNIKKAGHVNLYQICDRFVKSWTRNTGNSIALLMNRTAPLKAQVMISHAWSECIVEAMVSVLGKASASGITLETTIWFCTFAQYQPGDIEGDCGPGVAAQLALDPFKCVIASKPQHGMMVIHTSTADLYSRLWCVYEVNEADVSDVITSAAYSVRLYHKEWKTMHSELEASGRLMTEELYNEFKRGFLKIDSSAANCFSKDDAEMIKNKIVEAGGFEKLDKNVFKFRSTSWESMSAAFDKVVKWIMRTRNLGGRDRLEGYEARDRKELYKAFDSFQQSIMDAGVWVGMFCLSSYLLQDLDEEMYNIRAGMQAEGHRIIGRWTKFYEECPEGIDLIDPAKEKFPSSTEDITKAIPDISACPFALALLEVAAGGGIRDKLGGHLGHLRKGTDGGVFKKEDKRNGIAIQEVFKGFDDDKNGTIDPKELTKVMQYLDKGITEEECQLMFQAADANRDGVIDYNEFIDWLCGGLVQGSESALPDIDWQQAVEGAVCLKGHPLKLAENEGTDWECYLKRKGKSAKKDDKDWRCKGCLLPRMRCERCKFDLCGECFVEKGGEVPVEFSYPTGVLCRRQHAMTPSKKYYPGGINRVGCLGGCGKAPEGYRFSCSICEAIGLSASACMSCVQKLEGCRNDKHLQKCT